MNQKNNLQILNLQFSNLAADLGPVLVDTCLLSSGILYDIFGRIHEATGIDMSHDVFELLGYDHGEKKVKMGVLAENTHTQIKDKLSQLLKNHPEVRKNLTGCYNRYHVVFFQYSFHQYCIGLVNL